MKPAARPAPSEPLEDEIPTDDEGTAPEDAAGFRLPLFDRLDELETLHTRERSKPYKARLAHSIQRWGSVADEMIPLLSRDGADVQIWGDLDDDDAATLADALVLLGERNAVMAQATRGIVATGELADAGLITGRRAVKMIRYYMRHGVALNLRIMWGRIAGSGATG